MRGTASTNTAESPRSSPADPVLLLTNYPGSGIGDFGVELARALGRVGPAPQVETTRTDGRGLVRQVKRTIRSPGLVVANVGLTGWGPSGSRNLLGFLAIGIRGALGRPTVVLLHHAIEIIEPQDSGYPISRFTRRGAHLAVGLLRRCRLVVFAPRMTEILAREYRIHPAWTTPLPCDPSLRVDEVRRDDTQRPCVVSLGYLAPYKGLEMMVEIAGRLRSEAELVVIGGEHPILRHDVKFREQLARFREGITAAGGRVTGYLAPEELRVELSRASVALLAYTSMSGASASFSTLAGAGIPVVATHLPEFEFLREEGAAVELASPTIDSFAQALRHILSNPELRATLRARQLRFAAFFNWDQFAAQLPIIARGSFPTLGPVQHSNDGTPNGPPRA